jgi:hypothetical protein
VFVLNVQALPEADWGRLAAYLREGGGLVIAAGDRVTPQSINESATQLLPATLGEKKVPKEPFFTFGKADTGHPLFNRNTRDLLAELASVPVIAYSAVTPVHGTRTLLAYQNNDPALLERVFPGARAGRVLLWTTALSRRAGNDEQERRETWNEFPMVGWSFLDLMTETVPYLAGVAEERLTYEAGDDVRLPIDPTQRYTNYTVQWHNAKTSDRLGEPVAGTALVIPAPPQVGQWTVTASGPNAKAPATLGFSVNPPRGESQLTLLETKDLEALFGGKDNYSLIDNSENMNREVGMRRVGRELFPLLVLLILLVVTAENILANTFYRERTTAARPRAAAA